MLCKTKLYKIKDFAILLNLWILLAHPTAFIAQHRQYDFQVGPFRPFNLLRPLMSMVTNISLYLSRLLWFQLSPKGTPLELSTRAVPT